MSSITDQGSQKESLRLDLMEIQKAQQIRIVKRLQDTLINTIFRLHVDPVLYPFVVETQNSSSQPQKQNVKAQSTYQIIRSRFDGIEKGQLCQLMINEYKRILEEHNLLQDYAATLRQIVEEPRVPKPSQIKEKTRKKGRAQAEWEAQTWKKMISLLMIENYENSELISFRQMWSAVYPKNPLPFNKPGRKPKDISQIESIDSSENLDQEDNEMHLDQQNNKRLQPLQIEDCPFCPQYIKEEPSPCEECEQEMNQQQRQTDKHNPNQTRQINKSMILSESGSVHNFECADCPSNLKDQQQELHIIDSVIGNYPHCPYPDCQPCSDQNCSVVALHEHSEQPSIINQSEIIIPSLTKLSDPLNKKRRLSELNQDNSEKQQEQINMPNDTKQEELQQTFIQSYQQQQRVIEEQIDPTMLKKLKTEQQQSQDEENKDKAIAVVFKNNNDPEMQQCFIERKQDSKCLVNKSMEIQQNKHSPIIHHSEHEQLQCQSQTFQSEKHKHNHNHFHHNHLINLQDNLQNQGVQNRIQGQQNRLHVFPSQSLTNIQEQNQLIQFIDHSSLINRKTTMRNNIEDSLKDSSTSGCQCCEDQPKQPQITPPSFLMLNQQQYSSHNHSHNHQIQLQSQQQQQQLLHHLYHQHQHHQHQRLHQQRFIDLAQNSRAQLNEQKCVHKIGSGFQIAKNQLKLNANLTQKMQELEATISKMQLDKEAYLIKEKQLIEENFILKSFFKSQTACQERVASLLNQASDSLLPLSHNIQQQKFSQPTQLEAVSLFEKNPENWMALYKNQLEHVQAASNYSHNQFSNNNNNTNTSMNHHHFFKQSL